jgi:serine/threonine-protein kinase HipA
MRKGIVKYGDITAGIIYEDAGGYHFDYDEGYVNAGIYPPISKTMPLQVNRYQSNTLFPFFDGLIPEGWLLDIAEDNWKLDRRDRMGLLLACCKDCIGAVSIHPVNVKDDE